MPENTRSESESTISRERQLCESETSTTNQDKQLYDILFKKSASHVSHDIIRSLDNGNYKLTFDLLEQHLGFVSCLSEGETLLTFTLKRYKDTQCIAKVVEWLCKTSLVSSVLHFPDKGGFPPLQLSLSHANLTVFTQLLELGASPSATNHLSKESCLQQATRLGNKEIVQKLVQAGANLNHVKKTGETAVHIGAWENQLEVTQYLLRHGANVRTRSNSGSTALHWATERCNKEMIVLLLVAGADPSQRNHFGMKSTMIAEKRCGESVSSVFTQYSERLQQPLSLQYLARKAYLWQRPIGRECGEHVMCDGLICQLPHTLQKYLRDSDYFLLRTHQM